MMPQSHIRRYLRHGTMPQLSVLEAVLRHKNFSRAAEEQFLAQPTVSIQLKKLSEMIGLPLVEQIGRQVYPTEAGKYTLEATQKIFKILSELEGQLSQIRNLGSGGIRLAVGNAAKYFAPRLLADFATSYPDIDLSLQIHNRTTLINRLNANEDDLYIFANPPESADYVRLALFPNKIAVFCRYDHPLVGQKNIHFKTIADEPFLVREVGSGTRMMMNDLFQAHQILPKVRMQLSTNEAIKQAIISGLGISLMSKYTLGLDTDEPKLATLDIIDLPKAGYWYLVYPSGKHLSPIALAFIDLIRNQAKQLVADHLLD